MPSRYHRQSVLCKCVIAAVAAGPKLRMKCHSCAVCRVLCVGSASFVANEMTSPAAKPRNVFCILYMGELKRQNVRTANSIDSENSFE